MKKYLFFALLCTTIVLYSCETNSTSVKETVPVAMEKTTTPAKQLRHVVLFKFKEGTTAEAIQQVEAAFTALPSKISAIKGYEWGTNNSPEGLDKGFTHCFFLTFDSEEGRAVYLPHPDHKAFGEVLTLSLIHIPSPRDATLSRMPSSA